LHPSPTTTLFRSVCADDMASAAVAMRGDDHFFVTGPYSLVIDIGPDVCDATACTSSLSDADDVATTWLYAPPRVSERPTFSTVPRSPSRRVRTGVGTVGRGWRNTTCPHSSVRSNAGQASAISWTASSRDSD